MPLWDFELMNYWKDVPLSQKNKQNLYINYLKDYNYKKSLHELSENTKSISNPI